MKKKKLFQERKSGTVRNYKNSQERDIALPMLRTPNLSGPESDF